MYILLFDDYAGGCMIGKQLHVSTLVMISNQSWYSNSARFLRQGGAQSINQDITSRRSVIAQTR